MCKADGALGSGSGQKVDCGKCSCPYSNVQHAENPRYPNHCRVCNKVINPR